jgi:hypothetical protein
MSDVALGRFTPGIDTRCPLNTRLGGSVRTIRRKEKNLLPLPEFEPRTGLGCLITILTTPIGLTPLQLCLSFVSC